MARRSVIKLSYINNFFCPENKFIEKGENAVESGHVTSFCFDADNQFVKGSVLASMKDKSYKVEVLLKEDGDIEKAKCECPRGLVKCHHMAALLLHAHYNVSVTDKQCVWSKKTTKKEEATKTVADLFPPKKFKAVKSIPNDLKEETFKLLKEKQATVGFTWLLNPTLNSVNNTPLVIPPRDILFSEQYKKASDKEEFFKEKIKLSEDQLKLVREKTNGQSANWQWSVLRTDRLTSSNFGLVLGAIKRQSYPPSLFKRLLNTYNLDGVKSVEWGRLHEDDAAKEFASSMNLKVETTGLWLHESGILGASPDRIVHFPDGSMAIVEIKCPFTFRNSVLSEALKTTKKYIVTVENDKYVFHNDHEIFHQIQGQLHIAKCKVGFLVLWTLKGILTFKIEREESWANNLNLLTNFYFNQFIPHISPV